MPSNYYEILGVPPDATEDEISAAWKRHLKYWHPDRNSKADAGAKAKALNEAHDTLADPAKKADYDRRLADGSVTASDDSQPTGPATDDWQPVWTPPPGRYSARRTSRGRAAATSAATSAPPPPPAPGASWTAPAHSTSYDPAPVTWTNPSTAAYGGRWRYPYSVIVWFAVPYRRTETGWRLAGSVVLRLAIVSVVGLSLWLLWPTIVSLAEITFGFLVAALALYVAVRVLAFLGGGPPPKRSRRRRR